MTYQELRAALIIQGDQVSINLGALGAEVDALLRGVYLGQSVVIREAKPGPDDGSGNKVVISGRAAFLTTPYPLGVPVQATFTLDANGVHALIQYTMVGGLMPLGSWKFSQSFPALPGVFNYARIQPDGSVISPLDDLTFNDAAFFAASAKCTEPGYNVALAPGLNFAGRVRPSDLMGVFQQVLFGVSDTLVLSGPIFIPDPAVKLPVRRPLDPDRFPWSEEVVTPVPGIMLRAPLNAKPLTLGNKLSFQATEFRIFNPLTYAWLSQNSTYQPAAAFLGQINIPSAGIEIDLTMETQAGAAQATLIGVFQGVTVAKLASLLDFAGTDGLINDMPDEIKKIGDALGKLELEAAKIEIATGSSGLTVLGTSATIGMPSQTWRLWPGTDHFDVSKIYARFDVASPFSKPRVDVTVGGTIAIEGVPIKLRARKGDGFTAYAELGEAETIPLKSLMQTYIPAVPPPSDLTINAMSVIVAPGSYYSFTTLLAQQPNPWVISLGPKNLTISDVSLMLTYPSGGPIAGSFGGTIALESIATLTIAYDIPGALILRANLPQISLTDLAREIADVTNLPFPPGFPEIDLLDSFVQFERDTSSGSAVYDFILRTKVAIGSTPDFNLMALILKTDTATGFAAGIWTPNWAPGAGWSPGQLWKPLSAIEFDSAGLILTSVAPSPAQQRQMIPISDVPALQQDKFKVIAGVNLFASMRLKTGSVAVLKEIFGADTVFSLFAALGTDESTVLIAHLSSDYSKGIFTFNGFDLAWQSTGTSIATISATALGSLLVDGNRLSLTVTGAVSTDGTARIAFAVVNWVHPFGYQRLIVKDFAIAVAIADGVTITLQGTFDLTTKKAKSFLFAIAGAITDFEAPSALAFALRSDTPNQTLKIGEVLEGITTIDIYDLPPETTIVPWIAEIKLLDLFLEIQELSFWVVMADQVTIAGTTYRNGFGFRGDIWLFGREVKLYVEVQEATGRFAGSAEFPESIVLGNVLTLGRPVAIPIDSKQDLAVGSGDPTLRQGPAIQVSSFLDAQHKYYLFVAAHVVLLDIIKVDILGEANNDGIKFSYDLTAGKSGSGAWAAQKIDVLVSREKLACSAGLAYDFGLKDVTLGGFDLFGTLPIPKISLPNFEIAVSGTIGAGLLPPKFNIGGSLKFSFMGLNFDESFSIDVDLSQAPSKIADFGKLLLQWIKDNLERLLKAVLNLANAFADWVKKNFEAFKDAAEHVARVLNEVFSVASRDVAKGLMEGIGFAESAIDSAVNTVYGALKEACATTRAAMAM